MANENRWVAGADLASVANLRWLEERRYLNASPPESELKIDDVDIRLDEICTVTGVGTVAITSDVVIRYRCMDVLIYTFYKNMNKEPLKRSDISRLKNYDVLRRLINLDEEGEPVKKIVIPLKKYADSVGDALKQFPVEIKITLWPARVYVKLFRRVDEETFQRYVSICRQLGLKYDRTSSAWIWELPL